MMKSRCMLLMLCFMLFGIHVYANENAFEAKESGVVITTPSEFKNVKGTIYYEDFFDHGRRGLGIVMIKGKYAAMSEEEYNRLREEQELALKKDDMDTYFELNNQIHSENLFLIYGINGGRGADDLIKSLMEGMEQEEIDDILSKRYLEIGSYEGITYVLEVSDPELIRNAGPLPEFEDEYYEEYLFILENADLFKESIQLIGGVELMDTSVPAEEGNKIQFETTDLNGNTVRSEDLFAGHKLTMINLWATWCSPCKAELPDLEKLNQELSEKNCQIIGIVTDTDKDEKISKAKLILEKNGVTYLNLVTFEGLSDLLPQVSWPTSYFVEEDGTLFGEPVVGISMDNYLKVFDAIE